MVRQVDGGGRHDEKEGSLGREKEDRVGDPGGGRYAMHEQLATGPDSVPYVPWTLYLESSTDDGLGSLGIVDWHDRSGGRRFDTSVRGGQKRRKRSRQYELSVGRAN